MVFETQINAPDDVKKNKNLEQNFIPQHALKHSAAVCKIITN
jgi:hypothetical protein